MNKRRLIEDWLPIAALSAEASRERRVALAGNVLPPTTYLHVWFARRPLVASRAAVLGSVEDASADRTQFLNQLGIHGDPVLAAEMIEDARRTGNRIEDPHGYPRAWRFTPIPSELDRTVLDPTAGGGSISLETARCGFDTIANDLNPVAAIILKGTVELPLSFGGELLKRFEELSAEFLARIRPLVQAVFPPPDGTSTDATFLWARTVRCPYCGGVVPLAPNWKLSASGDGVRLVPESRRIRFEIVKDEAHHSPGTVKGGDGLCPFPECGRTIDGDEIKNQAQVQKLAAGKPVESLCD